MFDFFRVSDVLRLLVVLFFLLLLRLPLLLRGVPLLSPELEWMLVGERMAAGSILYKDTWIAIAPLSAWFYGLMEQLGPRSLWVHGIVSTILVFVQSLIFNTLLLRRDFLIDRSYVPAMIYIFMASLTFDSLVVSPALLGLTFLLIVVYYIFTLNERTQDQRLFSTGFYLGIATLFHLPFMVFFFWVSLGLGIFRSTSLRQHLLVWFGFSFPLILVGLYFYWHDALSDFLYQYSQSVSFVSVLYLSVRDYVLLLVFPTLFLLVSVLSMFLGKNLTNYQTYCLQMMIFWFVAGLFSLFLCSFWLPFQFIIFAPVISFFGTYYLFGIERTWLRELLFVCVLGGSALQLWSSVIKIIVPINYDKALVRYKKATFPFQNEKIWVIGDNYSYYVNNTPATPFLDWEIAKNKFSDIDKYQALLTLYEHIEKDKPSYIIDEQQFIPTLFSQLPILAKDYQQLDSVIYQLKTTKNYTWEDTLP